MQHAILQDVHHVSQDIIYLNTLNIVKVVKIVGKAVPAATKMNAYHAKADMQKHGEDVNVADFGEMVIA